MNDDYLLRTLLLEQEIACLRSVLSEYPGDKLEHTQMCKANAIAELLNHIVIRRVTFVTIDGKNESPNSSST